MVAKRCVTSAVRAPMRAAAAAASQPACPPPIDDDVEAIVHVILRNGRLLISRNRASKTMRLFHVKHAADFAGSAKRYLPSNRID